MGEDQAGVGIGVGEPDRVAAERRYAAAGVDEDRHAALGGEGEQRLDAGDAEREALGARVQLDADGAGVEAALRLGARVVPIGDGVDPAEGPEAAARGLGGPRARRR